MSLHIDTKKSNIAKTVLICGDPLRTKFMAEKYLTNPTLVCKTRLALIYTGLYKEKLVTIATSGMGMPSMGMYAMELYKDFDVEKIIRVGSAGSYYDEIKVRDVILAENAYTASNFAYQLDKGNDCLIEGSRKLNKKIIEQALKDNFNIRIGNIHTSDVYSSEYVDPHVKENFCLAVEMECFALFYLAKKYNRDAACLVTISNNIVSGEELTPIEIEQTFDDAFLLALNSVL